MHLDLHVFASVFAIIFIAELPDKTAVASLVLATRHSPWPVWLGASLALTVQSIVAVVAGALFAKLPAGIVHTTTGVVFLVSAVFMWRRKDEDDVEGKGQALGFWRAFATTFGVVFLAEWGDLTQVGTAALAAHYHAPFTVVLGSVTALWAVAALAVLVGNRAKKYLNPTLTQRIAAVVFGGVGVALLMRWF
jgi:putative Ca2+/H+ antiporter (TMEM165/GDT1 family)